MQLNQGIPSLRHEHLLRESAQAIQTARQAVIELIPHEMILIDLYTALRPIDSIVWGLPRNLRAGLPLGASSA